MFAKTSLSLEKYLQSYLFDWEVSQKILLVILVPKTFKASAKQVRNLTLSAPHHIDDGFVCISASVTQCCVA